MSVCSRCGKPTNSLVNCSGEQICHSCCKNCFHHIAEVSVPHCRERVFFNQLRNAGINVTRSGTVEPAEYVVVIPPRKPAHIAKAKSVEGITELIYNKVSLKPKSIRSHIYQSLFRLVCSSEQDRLSPNEKASSITDTPVKGTAILITNAYGKINGISEKAARFIANEINEFNKSEIIVDIGT